MKKKAMLFILVSLIMVGTSFNVFGYEDYKAIHQKGGVSKSNITLEVIDTKQASIFSVTVPLKVPGKTPITVVADNPDTLVSIADGVKTINKLDLTVDSNVVRITEPESKASIVERLNQQVRESVITTSIITQPVFINGESAGVIKIKNVEGNKHPQKVEIQLKDTKEVVYTSSVLNIGDSIEEIKLSKGLGKGTYPCIAFFMSMQDDKVIGKTGVEIVLNIQN